MPSSLVEKALNGSPEVSRAAWIMLASSLRRVQNSVDSLFLINWDHVLVRMPSDYELEKAKKLHGVVEAAKKFQMSATLMKSRYTQFKKEGFSHAGRLLTLRLLVNEIIAGSTPRDVAEEYGVKYSHIVQTLLTVWSIAGKKAWAGQRNGGFYPIRDTWKWFAEPFHAAFAARLESSRVQWSYGDIQLQIPDTNIKCRVDFRYEYEEREINVRLISGAPTPEDLATQRVVGNELVHWHTAQNHLCWSSYDSDLWEPTASFLELGR